MSTIAPQLDLVAFHARDIPIYTEKTPYYHLVPKQFDANLAFRKKMCDLARTSSGARQLRRMCASDLLFYVNTFVYTYDPRRTDNKVIPFITYRYQDEAMLEIDDAIGKHDLLIEKSRDMGATWCNLTVFEWRWSFRPYESFMCISRKEDYVDSPDDPDCLFWKLDLIRLKKPKFLWPPGFDSGDRARLKLVNRSNGSTIVGDSTTGDVGRGGRRTAIFLDEFASVEDGHEVLKATRDNTNSRLFNSTPKGQANAFYEMRNRVPRLTFLWTQHPEKAAGLYRTGRGGQVEILDKGYKYPPGYKFILDGKVRSPWYDDQCARAAHPQEIAQEIDIDYQGSDYQFFMSSSLDEIARRDVRRPTMIGDVDYSLDTLDVHDFRPMENGRLRLWMNLDVNGRIPSGRTYTIGGDVSQGTGSSNSAMAIYDNALLEQVGEYADPNLSPDELATVAVALARWFNGAKLIWEANGPGMAFGKRVVSLGYRNIFYRRDELSITGGIISDVPGFFHNAQNKLSNFVEFRRALGKDISVRSERFYAEAKCYVHTVTGKIEHSGSVANVDPTGARDNHGDIVIAHVIAWRGMTEVPIEDLKKSEPNEVPESCFGARQRRRQEAAKAAKFW